MITAQDLKSAIAECEGIRNPNVNTCIKLAAFYIIQEHMFGANEAPTYSYASLPTDKVETVIDDYGDNDFYKAISGKKAADMWAVMNELMDTMRVLNPGIYNGVLRKIAD